MTIWQNYISAYRSMLPMKIEGLWASWEGKGTYMNAITHSHPHFLKSRQVDISDGKNVDIFNCIAYPKTGSNLPCFGLDLMKFSDKKIIIVFDFQHPVENYLFSVGCWKSNTMIIFLGENFIKSIPKQGRLLPVFGYAIQLKMSTFLPSEISTCLDLSK